MQVEILDMQKKDGENWGNLKALVDIRIDDKIELFGIRIVKDMDGKLWVAMPSYVLMNQKKKSFVKVIHFTNLEDWIEVKTKILDYYLKGERNDGN